MKKQFSGLFILIIWCAGCFGVFAEDGHYFIEYTAGNYIDNATEPELVMKNRSDSVKCWCGYPAVTKTKYVSLATTKEEMATQLGWPLIGPNTWQKIYQISVTAPGLNFPPHNKTGEGSYSSYALVEVFVYFTYRQEYDDNGEKVGPAQLVKTTYQDNPQNTDPDYVDCVSHRE